ncbi:serine/threonine-protein kinase [Saccharomonospora sp. NB11]|uniref:serine/threonine-protein kinase n=1 Tax=Saccharomonospora sp. NB11 TaxID=1642298 RepID=UPI0018D1F669|nr:serine/threonine-protein kinase [Saccharomonospora sp. NB11]
MSDEGRLVAGRYRVIKRIGTGAMGAVWQAHDDVLHRTVAIKQLLLQPGLDENEAEDARQRTMREGRIAARLHHPNAITVFDVVMDDNGQPCLIMEYLPSTSLAQELQQHKTLPPVEVAKIGAQVAAALKEAHAVGIVHRDIKPGNILLAGNGTVKITDFGISRAKDDVTVTKTGMIAGTPAYLAPEVAIGGDPGPESDVFSLGSTLYAASEGQPPFGLSENTLGLLHAVAAGQINPPRRSGPLTSVLAVMLHPDVRHRPTAAQCEELLAAVARGETPLGGPGGEPTQEHPRADGGTAVLGAAGAAALGGAAGAAAANYADGHSGRLGDYGDRDYDDRDYDEYYDDPRAGQSHGGYDEYDDYDRYDDYDQYDRTAVAPGPQPTRAVPVESSAYGGSDASAGDRYDDYDDRYDDDRGYDGPPPAEDEEKGNWKVPAAIGAVVVIGMAAFVMWLFGGGGEDTTTGPGDQPPVEDTSQSSSIIPTTEPTTTTTEVAATTEPVEQENPLPVDPEPTSEETPEPTTDTTTDETTTTQNPITSTPDETEEPEEPEPTTVTSQPDPEVTG